MRARFWTGICFGCSVLVGSTVGLAKSSVEPAQSRRFTAQLDVLVPELMKDYGARGVAVGIIENGKVTATRYYGFADAEKRIPVSSSTIFQPASVAKSMTAAGVMLLAQDRIVNLNDPLFRHVTRWKLPPSELPVEQVTIGRVLSHTSGLSRHTTGIWTVNDRLPTLTSALSGDNPEKLPTLLVDQPGSRFSYSGAGYSLLQLLVEETTGKSFSTYMETRVLRPMGLLNSRIGWPPEVRRNEAKSYDEFGTNLPNYRTIELGAGGWTTNLPDFAKYGAMFAKRNWGRGPLSAASIQQMVTPAPNGKAGGDLEMGYGVFLETAPDGRKLVGHTGGNPGVGAMFSIDPESGNGIAVLLNRSWAHHVFRPIACAWRNFTRKVGAKEETCRRDWTGMLMNTVATKGLSAGKSYFDALYASEPERVDDQRMELLLSNFIGAGRYADAVAIISWHPKKAMSAALQEKLGDALAKLGDNDGARVAWSEALRLEPSRQGVQEKVERLTARVPERG